MNDYEAKQEAKKKRYQELAEKHAAEAKQRRQAALDKLGMIPMGQPILVGHHSERMHRAHLKRIDSDFQKGAEHDATADYYEHKAEGVGKGGVSSDDPDAIEKLGEKLEKAERCQDRMKAANKAIKLKDIKAGNEALTELGFSSTIIAQLRTPDFAGRIGFASYALTNNNAEIRRLKTRIQSLENAQVEETREFKHDGFEVVYNAEENRVQILFPGKPAEGIRERLKFLGFRWCPTNGAWQRHLNNAGKFAAENFTEWMKQ